MDLGGLHAARFAEGAQALRGGGPPVRTQMEQEQTRIMTAGARTVLEPQHSDGNTGTFMIGKAIDIHRQEIESRPDRPQMI